MNNFKVLLMAAIAGLATIFTEIASGSDLFKANDISIDVFGFNASRDKGGSSSDAWGPGVGLNYYLNRYVGIGADSYFDAFELPYLINVNALGRYEIPRSKFAVYGFGGFGRQWEHAAQWLVDIGGGGEYRFRTQMAFFADIREVFPDRTDNYSVFRFGFRLRFK